jgi:hypothetical protein
MIVSVEEAAEAIVSADAQARECRGIGERFGQGLQGSGVQDAPVRPAVVVVAFVEVGASAPPAGLAARAGATDPRFI